MNFYQLSFGIFSLKIYGMLLTLAFMVGAWNYYIRLEKRTILVDFFLHHFWRWVLVALLVGRVFTIALDPGIISNNELYYFFAFWEGNINFYGSLLGFLLIAQWDLKKHGYTFPQWIDIAMPSFLLGTVFADIAAFMTGAIYGKVTSLPWGIKYETFGVDILDPVHPIAIYALIVHLWLLSWAKSHEKLYERHGEKLAIRVGLIFFAFDFLLYFLSGDQAYLIFDILRIEQVFCLLIIGYLIWRGGQKKVL